MSTNLDLGDTRLILSACMAHGLLRNQAAYVLATAYWETNRTMEPVIEAYWKSEEWRKENLRYYPWHGRGYVQLTWEANYHKAAKATGADLISDPSKALQPDIAALIIVAGMSEGWFTGKKLADYITLKASNFVGARRIVNGTDKAQPIAEIAREYDKALLAEHYGVDEKVPVVNEHRDGTKPRKTPLSSTTILAGGAIGVAEVVQQTPDLLELLTTIGAMFNVSPDLIVSAVQLASAAWIVYERWRKFREGWDR